MGPPGQANAYQSRTAAYFRTGTVARRPKRDGPAGADDRGMKKLLEIVGMLLLIAGVCGVIRELTDGWFRFMGFTRFLTENVAFLQGREIWANVAVVVVGFAVLMIADKYRKA